MEKWIPSWRSVPIDYNHQIGVLENITQKCVFTNNLKGVGLRLRFQNRYNRNPMRLQNVSVAVRNRITGVCSPWRDVTLDGLTVIDLPAGGTPYSDCVEMEITAEDDVLVNLYFGEPTPLFSVVTTATGLLWQSSHHRENYHETDALGFTVKQQIAPTLAAEPYPLQFAAGLCEVDVLTDGRAKLIALFGDSITHMGYFSDQLAELLYSRFPGECAVVNAGIAGNRIQKSYPAATLFPGEGHMYGIAGKDRFEQDVYDGADPDIVFIMEGVNDCTHSLVFAEPSVPDAQDIFEALDCVAGQAHGHGSRVYVSTVSPFAAFGESWRDAAEKLRWDYNELIRQGGVGDGWVDLDAALRDPRDPHRMQEGMHLGDGVHPNWAGGRKMAEEVCRKLFAAL